MLYTHIGLVYYCENTHVLGHRAEHICASTIYSQMYSVTKAMHCKSKQANSLKPDPSILITGNLILNYK